MMCRLKGERRKRKLSPSEATVKELVDEGFSVKELRMVGFGYTTMAREGVSAKRIYNEGGANPLDLRHAGFGPLALKKVGIGAQALRYCGFSSAELRNAGFSTMSVQHANKEINKSLSAGDLSRLPQKHPHEPVKADCRLPFHMTPRIRQNVDWTPTKQHLQSAGNNIIAARKVIGAFQATTRNFQSDTRTV